MIEKKVYRYISFESFVDMVISKKLTLVHPTLFEDPKEMWAFNQYQAMGKINDDDFVSQKIQRDVSKIQMCNTYIQCWTSMSEETDAMWRIYSHNNKSLRISCKIDKINQLSGVICEEVGYLTTLDSVSTAFKYAEFPEWLYLTKRRAFSHENEVRIIYTMHIPKDEWGNYSNQLDFYDCANTDEIECNDGIKRKIAPDGYFQIEKSLNLDLKKKYIKIDFSKIVNFIDSVLVNPFAPEWFVDTVKTFCKQYEIKFVGKSKLYDK